MDLDHQTRSRASITEDYIIADMHIYRCIHLEVSREATQIICATVNRSYTVKARLLGSVSF